MNNLKYFDKLFTSGPLPKGIAIKYATENDITVNTVNDYFQLLLDMFGVDRRTINMQEFRDEMWSLVKFNKNILRLGQIVRLVNRRFTGNRYRIIGLHSRGFDVENVAQPKYKFYDLDYDSIDRILQF